MGGIRQFMFAKRQDASGQTLPFTRWDILLSVTLGMALMAAIAYSAEPHGGWSLKRGSLVGGTVVFVICSAQNRRAALGCAFSLVALRMGVGVFVGPHPIIFIAGAIATGWLAWLFLHNLE